ncbi:hypothetical protein AGMMS49928_25340 [Spirochaetia bacterium]|nr:hypothetical protein AGMMS49928_25300 [Spirochaetia bacterium]GHV71796.1 hypothetical protein AGMMS49928_25340 [Spirochaetia bacterium]
MKITVDVKNIPLDNRDSIWAPDITHDYRHKLLSEMEEFNTLDFNEDNIYSIIIWVIKHFNEYTLDKQL